MQPAPTAGAAPYVVRADASGSHFAVLGLDCTASTFNPTATPAAECSLAAKGLSNAALAQALAEPTSWAETLAVLEKVASNVRAVYHLEVFFKHQRGDVCTKHKVFSARTLEGQGSAFVARAPFFGPGEYYWQFRRDLASKPPSSEFPTMKNCDIFACYPPAAPGGTPPCIQDLDHGNKRFSCQYEYDNPVVLAGSFVWSGAPSAAIATPGAGYPMPVPFASSPWPFSFLPGYWQQTGSNAGMAWNEKMEFKATSAPIVITQAKPAIPSDEAAVLVGDSVSQHLDGFVGGLFGGRSSLIVCCAMTPSRGDPTAFVMRHLHRPNGRPLCPMAQELPAAVAAQLAKPGVRTVNILFTVGVHDIENGLDYYRHGLSALVADMQAAQKLPQPQATSANRGVPRVRIFLLSQTVANPNIIPTTLPFWALFQNVQTRLAKNAILFSEVAPKIGARFVDMTHLTAQLYMEFHQGADAVHLRREFNNYAVNLIGQAVLAARKAEGF